MSKNDSLKIALLRLNKVLGKAKKLLPPMPKTLLRVKPTSKTNDLKILRPGMENATWQYWKMPSLVEKPTSTTEPPALPMLLEEQAPPLLASPKASHIIGVPTRDLIVLPLWIASEGDLQELVMLELSSKHLLRRGMAEGLKTIPLESKEGRTLVVVIAPTNTPSVATTPYLKYAHHFEAAARLLPHQGYDLLLWRELGEICFGFTKENQFIWFSGSGENEVNSFLTGLIQRIAFHLQAELVLEKFPQSIHLLGSFSSEEVTFLSKKLQISVEKSSLLSELPPPCIPTPLLDLPSEIARTERAIQESRNRIKKIGALGLLVYLGFLLLGSTNLLIKEGIYKQLTHQFNIEKVAITHAQESITEWQTLRSAVDPTTYVLDLLSAVASKIQGEKIRLISLAGVDGRLQIVGEATDVSQAYRFIELIKKSTELQEYQWSSGQPKLAGKNSVRFELEGSLPHAKTSAE